MLLQRFPSIFIHLTTLMRNFPQVAQERQFSPFSTTRILLSSQRWSDVVWRTSVRRSGPGPIRVHWWADWFRSASATVVFWERWRAVTATEGRAQHTDSLFATPSELNLCGLVKAGTLRDREATFEKQIAYIWFFIFFRFAFIDSIISWFLLQSWDNLFKKKTSHRPSI